MLEPKLTESDKKWINENTKVSSEPLPWEQESESDLLEEVNQEGGEANNMPQEVNYDTYEAPVGDSNFLKLTEEQTKIRLCSKPWEIVQHELPGAKFATQLCAGEKCELCAKGSKKKYKYAYVVLNRKDGKPYIYEAPITVFRQIAAYATNEEYGDPEKYDLTINKQGEKPQITYTVMASPKQSELTAAELELLGSSGISLEDTYKTKSQG